MKGSEKNDKKTKDILQNRTSSDKLTTIHRVLWDMASMDIKSLYRLGRRKNMLAILGCLFGIFVGIATAGYMFIHPLAERDKTIAELKEENLQVCDENKDLRAENYDLQEDVIELKRVLRRIYNITNDLDTSESKISNIKEVITTANVK